MAGGCFLEIRVKDAGVGSGWKMLLLPLCL